MKLPAAPAATALLSFYVVRAFAIGGELASVMAADPLDPAIDKWLRSIEPRDELVMRLAVRGRFDTVRSNHALSARIDELWDKVNPKRDEAYMALVLDDVRMVGNSIEQLLDPNPKRSR